MSAIHPLRTLAARGSMLPMRLNSITANRHIFDDEVNGKPLRLLLNFDRGRVLRLQVAGNGEQMIADQGTLDTPTDMAEYGQTDVADVSQSLFPTLQGLEVAQVEALTSDRKCIGVKLIAAGGQPFHFWVDGDELHWGDEAALASHDWLDGAVPTTSERIEI